MSGNCEKEQIEAVLSLAAAARVSQTDHHQFMAWLDANFPALCQQALRAIELEADAKKYREAEALRLSSGWGGPDFANKTPEEQETVLHQTAEIMAQTWKCPPSFARHHIDVDRENVALQTELTAARNALEEERERCAKALEVTQSEADGARRRLAAERGRNHYEKVKRRWTQWEP